MIDHNDINTQLLFVDPPRGPPSELEYKILKYSLIAGCVILSPLLLIASPFSYAIYYRNKMNRINEIKRQVEEDKQREKEKRAKHDWRLKNEWNYRLSQSAPRISDLTIWQDHILECDQYERAILQISQANDVPYEIWKFIQYDTDEFETKDYLLEQMKVYGTDEYDKDKCVQYIYQYYVQKYAEFKTITLEDAEEHMKNIVDTYVSKPRCSQIEEKTLKDINFEIFEIEQIPGLLA